MLEYLGGIGWCDVIPYGDGFAVVYALDGKVGFRLPASYVEPRVQTDHLRFLKAATDGHTVAAVGKGADDRAYFVTSTGKVVDCGLVFGEQCCGIFHNGVGFVLVLQRTNVMYEYYNPQEQTVIDRLRFPFPEGTSQGFRDVTEAGVIFGDERHVTEVGGVTLHRMVERFRVCVGQINGTDQIDLVSTANKLHSTVIPGPAYDARVAVNNGRVAVCARSPRGAAVFTGPPFPAAVIAMPPKPQPKPEPQPQPKPEEPSAVILAPNKIAVVEAMIAAHPEINTKVDIDEVRGRLVDYVCHALNAPGQQAPWGRKARNADGSRKNGDGLTFLRPDGRFEIIDILSGTDGSATWDHKGIFRQGENGYWTPADGIPAEPGEPNTPPPDETPGEIELLRAKVATLQESLDNIFENYVDLAALVTKQGQIIETLQRTVARKGDPVEVKGTASILGFSKTVTSHGVLQ